MLRSTKEIYKYLEKSYDYNPELSALLTDAALTIEKQQSEISSLKQLLIKNQFGISTEYTDPAKLVKRYTNPILPDKLG
jgi:hypothetical protein